MTLVTKEKPVMVTFGGMVGAFVFLVGLLLFLFNPIVAVVAIVLGLLVSFASRRKKTVLVCPECGREIKTL